MTGDAAAIDGGGIGKWGSRRSGSDIGAGLNTGERETGFRR
jgi:hypothetical protein